MMQHMFPQSTTYSNRMTTDPHPAQSRINSILLGIENQFVYSILNNTTVSEINTLIQQKINEPFELDIKAGHDGGSMVRLSTTDELTLKVLIAYNEWHSQID